VLAGAVRKRPGALPLREGPGMGCELWNDGVEAAANVCVSEFTESTPDPAFRIDPVILGAESAWMQMTARLFLLSITKEFTGLICTKYKENFLARAISSIQSSLVVGLRGPEFPFHA